MFKIIYLFVQETIAEYQALEGMLKYGMHRVFWSHQFQHVLVTHSVTHKSLFKPRCLHVELETSSTPQPREMGVWGLCSVLCPDSSLPLPTCATPPSTELPPPCKSLHICPFFLCFGPRLPRMLQSPLSTFCLETSLLKALSSLGIFSSLQVTFGNNYTKCLAITEHGHHFSISYNIFLIIF